MKKTASIVITIIVLMHTIAECTDFNKIIELRKEVLECKSYDELGSITKSKRWIDIPSSHQLKRIKNEKEKKVAEAKYNLGEITLEKIIDLSRPVYLNERTLGFEEISLLQTMMDEFYAREDFGNYVLGAYCGDVIIYTLIGMMRKDGEEYKRVNEYIDKNPWLSKDWKEILIRLKHTDDVLIENDKDLQSVIQDESIVPLLLHPIFMNYILDYGTSVYNTLPIIELYKRSRLGSIAYMIEWNKMIRTVYLPGWIEYLSLGGDNRVILDPETPDSFKKFKDVMGDRRIDKYEYNVFQMRFLSDQRLRQLSALHQEGSVEREQLLRRMLGINYKP